MEPIVSVTADGTVQGTKIYINDQDITHHVRSLAITQNAGGLPRVILEFNNVDFDMNDLKAAERGD